MLRSQRGLLQRTWQPSLIETFRGTCCGGRGLQLIIYLVDSGIHHSQVMSIWASESDFPYKLDSSLTTAMICGSGNPN